MLFQTPIEFNKWLYSKEPILKPIPPKQDSPIKRLSAKELLKTRNIPDSKTCRKCGRHLPAEKFHYQPANRDGLMNHCIDCHREVTAEKNALRKQLALDQKRGRGRPKKNS